MGGELENRASAALPGARARSGAGGEIEGFACAAARLSFLAMMARFNPCRGRARVHQACFETSTLPNGARRRLPRLPAPRHFGLIDSAGDRALGLARLWRRPAAPYDAEAAFPNPHPGRRRTRKAYHFPKSDPISPPPTHHTPHTGLGLGLGTWAAVRRGPDPLIWTPRRTAGKGLCEDECRGRPGRHQAAHKGDPAWGVRRDQWEGQGGERTRAEPAAGRRPGATMDVQTLYRYVPSQAPLVRDDRMGRIHTPGA